MATSCQTKPIGIGGQCKHQNHDNTKITVTIIGTSIKQQHSLAYEL